MPLRSEGEKCIHRENKRGGEWQGGVLGWAELDIEAENYHSPEGLWEQLTNHSRSWASSRMVQCLTNNSTLNLMSWGRMRVPPIVHPAVTAGRSSEPAVLCCSPSEMIVRRNVFLKQIQRRGLMAVNIQKVFVFSLGSKLPFWPPTAVRKSLTICEPL